MKILRLSALTQNIGLGMLSVIAVFTFASCARKIDFATSQVVPAARGFVKVKKDNNDNYIIKMEISNLAEAERLQPSNQTYVVWMVANDERARNIGRLNSSTSFLSSKLKASFETTSLLKPTKVFITAEEEASIQYPGAHLILTTEWF